MKKSATLEFSHRYLALANTLSLLTTSFLGNTFMVAGFAGTHMGWVLMVVQIIIYTFAGIWSTRATYLACVEMNNKGVPCPSIMVLSRYCFGKSATKGISALFYLFFFFLCVISVEFLKIIFVNLFKLEEPVVSVVTVLTLVPVCVIRSLNTIGILSGIGLLLIFAYLVGVCMECFPLFSRIEEDDVKHEIFLFSFPKWVDGAGCYLGSMGFPPLVPVLLNFFPKNQKDFPKIGCIAVGISFVFYTVFSCVVYGALGDKASTEDTHFVFPFEEGRHVATAYILGLALIPMFRLYLTPLSLEVERQLDKHLKTQKNVRPMVYVVSFVILVFCIIPLAMDDATSSAFDLFAFISRPIFNIFSIIFYWIACLGKNNLSLFEGRQLFFVADFLVLTISVVNLVTAIFSVINLSSKDLIN